MADGLNSAANPTPATRASEEEIREVGRQLDAIMAQSPVALAVFDAPRMVLRYGNEAAAAALGIVSVSFFMGLTAAQILERGAWKFYSTDGALVPPEDTPLGHVARGSTVADQVLLIERPDGVRRWYSVSVTPVRGEDGSLRAMAMVFPDITDRRRNEEALQYRRDLEHLIGSISTRFVNSAAADADDAIQDALEAIGRFTGADRAYLFFFRPAERMMDNTHEWCAPGIEAQKDSLQNRGIDDYKSFYEPILRTETILIPRVSEHPAAPDSVLGELRRQFIKSIICVPIVFRRKVVGFMGLDAVRREAAWAPDVDSLLRIAGELCANALDHMRTEQALRQSEERYRVTSDIGNHLLYDCSIADDRVVWTGRITALTGYEPRELADMGLSVRRRLVHPDDIPEATRVMDEAIRDRALYRAEYRMRRKDGSYMPVEDVGVFFFQDEGAPVRMIGSVRDVTERNLLQDQLQQALKMEAVGRLAGGVAHDFNNLLTTIMGNLELARSNARIPPGLADCLDEIGHAAESAASLTRQLLAFSRRQIIEPRPLSLNALVMRLEPMLRRLIGEDISLRTELAADLGTIKADAGQLEQVLMNLAVNARDAMPGGGVLLIGTGNVELDAAYCRPRDGLRPGAYVRLTVDDTGHGMSDEVKSHLFEPFFTTKPAGRGTGLGLATIFGIVKQSGGDMDVDSAPGRGTTFIIHLPLAAAEPAAPAPAPDAAADAAGRPDMGSETVLLVEDEPGVRGLARTVLERHGYTVIAAAGGEEALALAAAHPGPIGLLFTDVVMPGLNGRELADRLLGLRPETKVLYASGYTEDSEVLRGVVSARLAFMTKPYSPRTLAAKIRQVLDGA
jgi:PAS domain S-box-containing protein